MEGYQIVKELHQSGKFQSIYLTGGAAANLHILRRGLQLSPDLISDFDVEIYTNGDYDQKEIARAISTLREVLKHHQCQFPEEVSSIISVKIDSLDFDFFINEDTAERTQIIDGIPVLHIEDLIDEYRKNIIGIEDDLAYVARHPELPKEVYLEGKRDRYRKRLTLLA